MEAYTSFAAVYDTFMDNIPYKAWSTYLIGLLKKYGVDDGLVLELGCGTGNMTRLLAEAGYDMIGIDLSEDMLMEAMAKTDEEQQGILYLNQDMRSFELYGTVRAIVSICDSMNYILEEEDLLDIFRLANNYLDPGGVFIFDLNTAYKYETLGDATIAESREDCSFIWDNDYDETAGINTYELSLFIKDDQMTNEDGGEIFRRFREVHCQRAYSIETIRRLIERSGMIFEGVYDAFTDEPPKTSSERIYVIAREHGKKIQDKKG